MACCCKADTKVAVDDEESAYRAVHTSRHDTYDEVNDLPPPTVHQQPSAEAEEQNGKEKEDRKDPKSRPMAVTDDKSEPAAAGSAKQLSEETTKVETEDDAKATSDSEPPQTIDRRSCRVAYDDKGAKSFFAGIEQGAFHASANGLEKPSRPGEYKYEEGYKVTHDGNDVGIITARLGQGAMGTVYSVKLPDGSVCAAKAVREDFGAKARVEMEKKLAVEVSICFAMGRSPLTASVIRMVVPLPGVETTAKGLLLLCDLVDGGDLEEAMHSGAMQAGELIEDYDGMMYAPRSQLSCASITLQIYLAFDHMHGRGIIHQDFKPANLMMCNNGLVKVTDYGLATFSRKLARDPWNSNAKLGAQGQLCARLEGGTEAYFSPEQCWLWGKISKVRTEEAYINLKERWQLTPATSDLFQAALVVFEMHARKSMAGLIMYEMQSKTSCWTSQAFRKNLPGPGNRGWGDLVFFPQIRDALRGCLARRLVTDVAALVPEDAEKFVVEKLKFPQLGGKLLDRGADGRRLLTYVTDLNFKDVARELGISPGQAKSLQNALLTSMCTHVYEMHPAVGTLLEQSLHELVGNRPVSAKDVLKLLGAEYRRRSIALVTPPEQSPLSRSRKKAAAAPTRYQLDLSKTVGFNLLPLAAMTEATEHCDKDVSATLGDLAKALVLGGEPMGALAACTEWLGVASSAPARKEALDAYCNLWKRHAKDLAVLDLSKAAHGHWREEMLAGDRVIERLGESLWAGGGPPPSLAMVDLSLQSELNGKVMEILLGETGIPALRKLCLSGCTRVAGVIPRAIQGCTALRVLDLSSCKITGPSLSATLQLLQPVARTLQSLHLSGNTTIGSCEMPGDLIVEFTNLIELGLSGMALRGTIPKQLGALVKLRKLYLAANKLSANIPAEFENLAALESLDLSKNKLNGDLPVVVGKMKANGCTVELNANQAFTLSTDMRPVAKESTDTRPEGPGDLELHFMHCCLRGPIPTQLGTLVSSLISLRLSNNQLTGLIPPGLGALTRLEVLDIGFNQLTETIPVELGKLTHLQTLDLGFNQLKGEIPKALGDITSLTRLDLQFNQLTGEVCEELRNLTKLQTLCLNGNEFRRYIDTDAAKEVLQKQLPSCSMNF